MTEQTGKPDEGLARLARFAFEWSGTLCQAEHGCESYHRMWSAVRLIEAGGALPAGEAFMTARLPEFARNGSVRILLSGTADTGLLALMHRAALANGIGASFTVIDRCQTPLEQCRLYGLAHDLEVVTIRQTPDQIAASDHDLVVAHSFLSFIPPPARAGVLAGWARALRKGGGVLLSQRLVAEGDAYARKRPVSQLASRRAALSAALERNNPLPAAPEKILDAAEAMWTNAMGGNGISQTELAALAEGAGLELQSVTLDTGQDSVSPFALKEQAVKRARAEIVLVKA